MHWNRGAPSLQAALGLIWSSPLENKWQPGLRILSGIWVQLFICIWGKGEGACIETGSTDRTSVVRGKERKERKSKTGNKVSALQNDSTTEDSDSHSNVFKTHLSICLSQGSLKVECLFSGWITGSGEEMGVLITCYHRPSFHKTEAWSGLWSRPCQSELQPDKKRNPITGRVRIYIFTEHPWMAVWDVIIVNTLFHWSHSSSSTDGHDNFLNLQSYSFLLDRDDK